MDRYRQPLAVIQQIRTPMVATTICLTSPAAAISTPLDELHPRAKIVTSSGAIYGWDAIEAMQVFE